RRRGSSTNRRRRSPTGRSRTGGECTCSSTTRIRSTTRGTTPDRHPSHPCPSTPRRRSDPAAAQPPPLRAPRRYPDPLMRRLRDLDWPLTTARLTLRPGRSEDAVAIWPWYRLPEVQEWTTTLSPTLEAHQEHWDDELESAV